MNHISIVLFYGKIFTFISKCVKNDVLPKSFRTKPTLNTRRGYALTLEYNKRMLKATRDTTKEIYHKNLQSIRDLNNELKDAMFLEDFDKITNITDTSRENKLIVESKRLKEKYEKLSGKRRPFQMRVKLTEYPELEQWPWYVDDSVLKC